jgi:hypothetical protein
VRFRPAQIHAQDHLGPVLRLGATSAGLDIDIRITGVHFAGKHATEFQASDPLLDPGDVTFHLGDGIGVVFLDGKFEQFAGVLETARDFIEPVDDLFELRTLLPQRLRALGFVPDVRLLEFASDFGQAFGLAVVVKDTSSTHRCVQ